jgi:hypothetical protein
VFNPAARSEEEQHDLHMEQVYEQTKNKFFELLLKRFHDKSAFCRIKVMKVFRKLVAENLVPEWMYMSLFQAVIGRLRDQAVNVRKSALGIFQDLLIVCGWIFNVDMRKNERF